jgi:superfamily I DNA and RNA helicase
MFDEPTLWQEIGYEIKSGQLEKGREISLRRSQQATPRYFRELLTPDDAVKFASFQNSRAEFDWVAESIATNLKKD